MAPENNGYWYAKAKNILPGDLYAFKIDNKDERPDPASNFQPNNVHNRSQIIDHSSFKWTDSKRKGIPLKDMIIYELHIGTFTKQGTFNAAIEKLTYLIDLGINTIEIMPISQFPGNRNWGYDGVHPYAVQNSYGTPDSFKALIDKCHKLNISVILDVVYNHLGPEGNYLHEFGPYFTNRYKTPWGDAINFDGKYSDEVRKFFIQNALFWFENYHIDALRLDAIHGIYDFSAKPFLEQLSEEVAIYSQKKKRPFYLIAESDLNDVRAICPKKIGGYGIHAQWNDDFHHCIHTLLTKETNGYYADFGSTEQFVKSLNQAFVYSWEYSKYRNRHHGNSSKHRPADQFIVFSQNHDQIGNRMNGDRLIKLAGFEACKLAAGAIIFSPYIPLIFMGEEYGEDNPFLYFISHTDKDLIKSVQLGRKKEFESFQFKQEMSDPYSEKTFSKSRLDWSKKNNIKKNKTLLNFYKKIISLRKEIPALARIDKASRSANIAKNKNVVVLYKCFKNNSTLLIMNFSKKTEQFIIDLPKGKWTKLIDSSDKEWGGQGTLTPSDVQGQINSNIRPHSFTLYRKA